MVLVRVGDEQPLDPILVLDEIREVGDDDVHPVLLGVREGDAAVNDDEIVALFKYRTILSDFAGPAQGDQS